MRVLLRATIYTLNLTILHTIVRLSYDSIMFVTDLRVSFVHLPTSEHERMVTINYFNNILFRNIIRHATGKDFLVPSICILEIIL